MLKNIGEIVFFFVVLGAIGTAPLVMWLAAAIASTGSPRRS
jgi:hypothetical protein